MPRAAAARRGASWTFGPLQGAPKQSHVEEFEFLDVVETEERPSQGTPVLERLLSKIIEQQQPASAPSNGSNSVLRKASSSISALLPKAATLSSHSPRRSSTDVQQPHGSEKQLLNRAVAFVLEGTRVRMFPSGDSGDSGDSGCEILGMRETTKRPTPHSVRTACCPLSHRPALVPLAHLPRG